MNHQEEEIYYYINIYSLEKGERRGEERNRKGRGKKEGRRERGKEEILRPE